MSTSTTPPGLTIGLDIGGTKTLGVLLQGSGAPLATAVKPTARENQGVVATAADVVHELVDVAQDGEGAQISNSNIFAVGVGIPGTVDPATGTVKNAVNLGIADLHLREELEGALGIHVDVANDVDAAALGAVHELGLTGSVAYLNIGTGMAVCLVQDGHIYKGVSGVSGEIGHIPVDPAGVKCPCGQTGCLETLASGSAVSRLWKSSEKHASDSLLQAHLAGDPQATEVFNMLADGIAQAVRLLVLTYDPEVVIMGGGIRKIGKELLTQVDEVFDRWSEESPFIGSLNLRERLFVLPEDSDAGAVGAALLSQQK